MSLDEAGEILHSGLEVDIVDIVGHVGIGRLMCGIGSHGERAMER